MSLTNQGAALDVRYPARAPRRWRSSGRPSATSPASSAPARTSCCRSASPSARRRRTPSCTPTATAIRGRGRRRARHRPSELRRACSPSTSSDDGHRPDPAHRQPGHGPGAVPHGARDRVLRGPQGAGRAAPRSSCASGSELRPGPRSAREVDVLPRRVLKQPLQRAPALEHDARGDVVSPRRRRGTARAGRASAGR